MSRFKLGVCFATEGGVEGQYKGEYIELRNFPDRIGLVTAHHNPNNQHRHLILNWYSKVLHILLEEELVIDGHNLGCGAILKLDPGGKEYDQEVRLLLWCALYKKTGSRGFASAVFEKLNKTKNCMCGPYLAGLNSEELRAFLVSPPLV